MTLTTIDYLRQPVIKHIKLAVRLQEKRWRGFDMWMELCGFELMEDGLNLKFLNILSNVGIINRIPSATDLRAKRKPPLSARKFWHPLIADICQLPAAVDLDLQHSERRKELQKHA